MFIITVFPQAHEKSLLIDRAGKALPVFRKCAFYVDDVFLRDIHLFVRYMF